MEAVCRPPEFPRPFGSRYVLLKELARGGMGRVFLALVGGRVCAVKTLLPDMADPVLARRFLDEAKLATQLSHPNLVYVSEAGSEEGAPYLAMEYLRGKNLHQVFQRCAEQKRDIPLGLSFFIIKELLRGLSYLHGIEGLNVVHRDLAPSNLFLSYEGGIKIVDLGLAKWRDRLSQTMVGNAELGQGRYISPEQKFVKPVDARSDIYSAGVIFWEMVTGHTLKRETVGPGRLSNIALPSQVVPTLPIQLDPLVMDALADDPADRYQSADQAIAKLTPNMSAEHEATALHAFLTELFEKEIRQEAEQEKRLVALAKDVLPAQGLPETIAQANPEDTTEEVPDTSGRVLHRKHLGRWSVLGGLALLLFAAGAWVALRLRTTEEKLTRPTPVGPASQPEKPLPNPDTVADPAAVPVPSVAVPIATRLLGRRPVQTSSAQLLERAKAYCRSYRFAEALIIVKEMVKNGSDNLEARLLLGRIYIGKKQYREALVQYEEALKISPQEEEAIRGRDLARSKIQ